MGLDEGLVDTFTGTELDSGQRFGAFFTSPSQLIWEESNAAFTYGASMQTHSRPGNSWNWDEERCNEKIESIQVVILCDGCSPNDAAGVRVSAEGAMLGHSCRGEALPTFTAPGGTLKVATLEATIANTPEDGSYLRIPDEVWDDAQVNTELSGLGAFVSGWGVSLVPSGVEILNEELAPSAIEDIVLRINYTDQTDDVWGGVDGGEATCRLEEPTNFNPSESFSCSP